MYGKENTLICHVSNFHPPDIEIKLLKNGKEIPGWEQTDLAFEKGWDFHLTRSVAFNPASGDTYSCQVRHMKNEKSITWGKTEPIETLLGGRIPMTPQLCLTACFFFLAEPDM